MSQKTRPLKTMVLSLGFGSRVVDVSHVAEYIHEPARCINLFRSSWLRRLFALLQNSRSGSAACFDLVTRLFHYNANRFSLANAKRYSRAITWLGSPSKEY
jgi:hypothetical protein